MATDHVGARAQRRSHRGVEAGRRPQPRHLHRVDGRGGAEQPLEHDLPVGADGVVAMPPPPLGDGGADVAPAGLRDDLANGTLFRLRDDVALEAQNQEGSVGFLRGVAERDADVGLVVQAHHGRVQLFLCGAPNRDQSLAERFEGVGAVRHDARRGTDRERRLGHDPERPLASDEQAGEIGPGRRGRRGPRANDRSAGEHDLEPQDHVLEPPVARGLLPGGARGDPAAHRRDLDRLGEMTERQASSFQIVFQRAAADPGLRRHCESLRIDGQDPVHPAHVEGDRSGDRLRAARHPGAAAERHHRRARFLRPAQDDRNLFRRSGAHHRRRSGERVAAPLAQHRERPPVSRVRRQIGAIGRDGSFREQGDKRGKVRRHSAPLYATTPR